MPPRKLAIVFGENGCEAACWFRQAIDAWKSGPTGLNGGIQDEGIYTLPFSLYSNVLTVEFRRQRIVSFGWGTISRKCTSNPWSKHWILQSYGLLTLLTCPGIGIQPQYTLPIPTLSSRLIILQLRNPNIGLSPDILVVSFITTRLQIYHPQPGNFVSG